MFCSQCGAKIETGYKFCPVCGASQNTDPAPIPSPTPSSSPAKAPVQKKSMPLWFKILVALAVLALIAVTAGILFTESLVDSVDKQLELLRHNEIKKAYYDYTSKDFQEATSFEEFKDFVEAYPIFLDNQSANFTERSIENHVGTIKGKITSSDHRATPIEYKLVKEDGAWKILSIRLLKPGTRSNSKSTQQASQLIEMAKSQLQTLENGQIDHAYEKYSSKEFKSATTLDDFKDFIKKYPIMTKHDSASFHKPVLKKEIGTLAVILHSGDTAAYLKYYFIYEDQAWKVWSIRILSPTDGEEDEKQSTAQSHKPAHIDVQGPMRFSKIALSDQTNEQDIVQEAKTIFSEDTGDLYVNVEITDGRVGETITLTLEHVESRTPISPIKAKIENAGDSLLFSAFSPPAKGWPPGHYTLTVTSSTGLKDSVAFEIK